MGYVGDYVHYRYNNYRQFGTKQSSSQASNNSKSNFVAAYRRAKNDLISLINASSFKGDVKQLEQAFNDMKNSAFNNVDTSNSGVQHNGASKLTQVLENNFQKSVNLFYMDFTNLGAIANSTKMKYNSNNEKRYMEVTLNKFKRNMDSFAEALQEALKRNEITQAELTEYTTKLQQLSDEYVNLSKTKGWNDIKLDRTKNMFKAFNNLIAQTAPPSDYEYGQIGEAITPYIFLRLQGYRDKQAANLIEKELFSKSNNKNKILIGKQGLQTSLTQLSGRFIDTKSLQEEWGGSGAWKLESGKGENQILTTVKASPQTIDVQVDWNGYDVRGSIKNYSSKYNMHIVTGVPLTSLFSLINTDFVNHYLNILALNYKSGASMTGELNFGTEIMKKALIARGLSGARGIGNAQANLLIINERSNGKTHIVDIGLILRSLLNLSNQALNTYTKITPNLPKKVNNELKGGLAPSLEGSRNRITAIINELHSYKLDLTLKTLPKV